MKTLSEAYRPTSFSAVLGQDKVVRRIQTMAATRGLGGKAYWLTGQSGTGKTTIARLMASQVASDDFVLEVDSSDLTVSRLKELEGEMQLSAMGKGGRGYLINEAHGLRRDVVRQLLVVLERLPGHVIVVFTTTNDGMLDFEDGLDAAPLLSRCIRLALTNQGLAKIFADRAHYIAEEAGLNGRDHGAYLKLVQAHKNNLRAVLMAVEAGEMSA